MRTRTEDLLTLRDGEPLDAALRERLVANPENVREIERLRHVADDLRRLPAIEPPRGVWTRIESEAGAARRRRLRASFGIGAAALAASVLAAALVLAPWQGRSPTSPLESPPPVPPVSTASPSPSDDYAPLVEESVRLQRLLAELGRTPQRMNAGTASTIASLEDHLVLVDEQLTYAEARDFDGAYRRALWRERVDVMNALVHVRYAQHWNSTY